jgi:hypothetical protein
VEFFYTKSQVAGTKEIIKSGVGAKAVRAFKENLVRCIGGNVIKKIQFIMGSIIVVTIGRERFGSQCDGKMRQWGDKLTKAFAFTTLTS